MEVTLLSDKDGVITAQVSLAPHCLVNPKITVPNGKAVSSTLAQNLVEMQKLLTRKNYLEVMLAFASSGLEASDTFITDTFVPLNDNGSIYGVTPDYSSMQLLSRTSKVDIFKVMEEPSYEVAEEYRNFYSSGKLNMRDAVSYYKFEMSEEDQSELKRIETELSIRSHLSNWVNGKKDLQDLGLDLTIDMMVERLDTTVGSEKIFAACWHNVEGYTKSAEISVIQTKVLPTVEREFIPYYVFLFDLLLNKPEDKQLFEQLYTVRYLLGHLS